MKAKIEIQMDNAVFTDDPNAELARILRDLADNLEAGDGPGDSVRLRDYNGNTVGFLEVSQ